MRILSLTAAFPGILRRKTSSERFLPQIDGLRFLAIVTVLAVHIIAYTIGISVAPPRSFWFWDTYEHLARGVQLFFVISGFVITMPFALQARNGGPRVSLRAFFVRRLTRLEPPFLIAMLLTFVALILVHHSQARALLPHMLATCTYTHALIYGYKSPIAFITWSLEIEIQFYLTAPLMMTALRLGPSIRRVVFVSSSGIALVLQGFIAPSHPVMALSLIAYLPFFLCGIVVCDLAVAHNFWKNYKSVTWDAIGVIALVAAYSIPTSALWTNSAMTILLGIGVTAVFRGLLLAQWMSLPWLTAIGGMCYTIYLLHVPLIYLFGHVASRAMVLPNPTLNVVIGLMLLPLPVLVSCFLFFLVVEKPCMNKQWPRDVMRFVIPAGPDRVTPQAASL